MDPGMWHDSDDSLMQELKEALARERAVPDHVIHAAMDVFDLRELDAELELLTLTFDSLTAGAADVRGPAQDGPRMLRLRRRGAAPSKSRSGTTCSWAKSCRRDRIESSWSAQMAGWTRRTRTKPVSSFSAALPTGRSG